MLFCFSVSLSLCLSFNSIFILLIIMFVILKLKMRLLIVMIMFFWLCQRKMPLNLHEACSSGIGLKGLKVKKRAPSFVRLREINPVVFYIINFESTTNIVFVIQQQMVQSVRVDLQIEN